MSRSKTPPCRLALEQLGPRELPAGISLADGVLTIAGSDFDDRGTVAVQNVGTPGLPVLKVVATLAHRATPTSRYVLDDTKSYFITSVTRVVFQGEGGDDTFTNTTSQKSTALGGDGNDTLRGGRSADWLIGGAGNDWLEGGRGDDFLYGDHGFSLGGPVSITPGNDKLLGGEGNDWLDGQGADDQLNGGVGDDKLWGTAGADVLVGGEGNDKLFGGAGDDVVFGDHGISFGGAAPPQGNDTLDGGAGDDVLDGQGGDDRLDGGLGGDNLWGSAGADVLAGGDGGDKLFGGTGADVLKGEAGNDILDGGSDNDALSGADGNDVLKGGGGNDQLKGSSGVDTLAGGAGGDWLDGGKDGDADSLTGGTGNDTFAPEWFSQPGGWKNRDKPQDFHDTATEKDRFVVGADWPVAITFTTIRCIEDTDGPGDDEPYVVFWVGNLNNPAASYTTRTSVFDMEAGDIRVKPTTVWGTAPIADPNDLVILASVLENDEMDPDGVVSTVNGLMLPSLLSAVTHDPPLTRTALVAQLKSGMKGALATGAGSALPGAIDDEFSSPKEFRLTADLLDQARNGLVPTTSLTFSFDGATYQVRLKFTSATGLE
jgi:hypothetical protein